MRVTTLCYRIAGKLAVCDMCGDFVIKHLCHVDKGVLASH